MQTLLDHLAAYRRYLGTYLEDAALYWRGFSRVIADRWWLRLPMLALTIGALLLVALHPLMFGTLPDSPDGLLHLYRLVALDHAISEGNFWPRYAPGLAFGYGLPIFNYYAPLYLYPFELLHLAGLDFVDALLAGMGFLVVVGAVGAYQMGRMWSHNNPGTGLIAGLTATVAYAYAPYTFYNMPRRWAVAEFAALAVLPWVTWAFWRLAERGTRLRFFVAVLLYALFIPLHNITTIAGSVLVAAMCFYLWQRSRDHRDLLRLAAAGAVGISLMCFFWLPALAETDYAQINRATENVGAIQVENNFHTVAETFALPRPADLTEIHPPVPRPVGWVQLILGIAAVGIVAYQGRYAGELWRVRGWVALSLLLTAVFILLTLPVSGAVYRYVPLLGYTQFPWRMLGPASLMLAVLAGAGVVALGTLLKSFWGKAFIVSAAASAMVLYAMPWLYGVYIPRPQANTIVDAQNFERATGWVGTASFNEYLPVWTRELPPQNQLTGLYASTLTVPRLQTPPADVAISDESWGLVSGRFTVDAPQPTRLTFNWLYFPGFWVEVNGERPSLMIIPPSGTFAVDVPAGQSEVVIGLGPTTLRFLSMIVSGAAVVLLLGLTFVQPLWQTPIQSVSKPMQHTEAYVAVLLLALLSGLLLFAAKLLYFDNNNTLLKRARFAEGIETGLDVPVRATFEDQVLLLGYSGLASTASGGALDINLYWQLAGETINQSYASILFLSNADGNIITLTGNQHAGDWPVWAWLPGFYVEERLKLDIPTATPPGNYELHVALYDTVTARNLDVRNVDEVPVGVSIQMDDIFLQRPVAPVTLTDVDVAESLGASLIGGITLVEVSAPPATLEVGQSFTIEWLLQSASRFEQDYRARVLWLADADVVAASRSLEPATGYPTSEWRRGDIWRGIHVVTLPGQLPADRYEVALQLEDQAGGLIGERVIVGEMQVSVPERTFEVPARIQIPTEIRWENGINLIGYDLVSRVVPVGDGIQLRLYLQPDTQIDQSLTLFIHLLAQQGKLIAQQDTIPVNGTRPTTGWLADEVLTDDITLFIREDIPPGEYRLSVGWYDANTGERIKLGEDDFTLLPDTILITP